VPAERIAENLAFINWTVLTGMAVGSFGAVALGRLRTDATRGYLAFTAVSSVILGLLAVASDGALPLATTGSAVAIDPAFDLPRRLALWLFCGLAAAYAVAIIRRRRAPALALAGVASGLAVLVLAGLSWGGSPLDVVLLSVQLAALAAARPDVALSCSTSPSTARPQPTSRA